jgi:hypothetical protein
VQFNVASVFTKGLPPTSTVAENGIHAPTIIGVQGCGVKTPIAAAVAEETAGFAIELHMPNGVMLTLGTVLSEQTTTLFSASTPCSGITLSGVGAAPKEQHRETPPVKQTPK